MASPCTSTNSPDLSLQVGNLAKEVTSKLNKDGLTLAETDWLEFNRLLLEQVLLLNHLVGHHHHNQRAPSLTSPSLSSAGLRASSLPPSSSSARISSPLHRAPKKPQRSKKRFADRACRQCGTATTSQWRTGPLGPSTLCNACGIRYWRAHRKQQQQEGHQERSAAEFPSPEVLPSPPALRGSVQFMLN